MAHATLPSSGLVLLDALPGTAALVAADGTIVAVNERWAAFGIANGGDPVAIGLGANYFATCACAPDDPDARAADTGIREVIAGRLPEFTLTYPCHSPDTLRWFRVTATPCEYGGERFALVLHVNVTESEQRLRLLAELTGAALLELDPNGSLLYATTAWAAMSGGADETPLASDRSWLDAFDPADAAHLRDALATALSTGSSLLTHARLRADTAERRGPNVRRMRLEGRPQLVQGEVARFAVTVVDAKADPMESARMRGEALRDPLTRLLNRAGLAERLETDPLAAGDAVMCIDLDGFKLINDTAGHATGDAVLSVVGARIRGSLRANDIAVRLGGDEFAIVLRDVEPALAQTATDRLLARIAEPINAGSETCSVSASIGITSCTDDGSTIDDLLARADAALLEAKAAGTNRTMWHARTEVLPHEKPSGVVEHPSASIGHGEEVLADRHWRPGAYLVTSPETDAELVDVVSRYLMTGFSSGEAALLIATDAHTCSIVAALEAAGTDVDALRSRGQFVALDADRTLAEFMRDGRPDPMLYRASVGAQVQTMNEQWPRVRAYAEMVAVLWSSGQVSAALALQDLWNDLADELPLLLVCAYQPRAAG